MGKSLQILVAKTHARQDTSLIWGADWAWAAWRGPPVLLLFRQVWEPLGCRKTDEQDQPKSCFSRSAGVWEAAHELTDGSAQLCKDNRYHRQGQTLPALSVTGVRSPGNLEHRMTWILPADRKKQAKEPPEGQLKGPSLAGWPQGEVRRQGLFFFF